MERMSEDDDDCHVDEEEVNFRWMLDRPRKSVNGEEMCDGLEISLNEELAESLDECDSGANFGISKNCETIRRGKKKRSSVFQQQNNSYLPSMSRENSYAMGSERCNNEDCNSTNYHDSHIQLNRQFHREFKESFLLSDSECEQLFTRG